MVRISSPLTIAPLMRIIQLHAMKISVSENGNEGGTYHELSDSRTAFRNETAGDEA